MNMQCFVVPNPTGPTLAVSIDPERCVGCNSCADICRVQTVLPNPVKGQPPIVAYPDECWYCGCCVEACPRGALEMHLPINQRIFFKRKETGKIFRIGADDCPPKSYFKPPVGWLAEAGDVTELVWKMLLARKREKTAAVVSPGVCGQLEKLFGDPDGAMKMGKVAAMLRRIGFDKVFLAEEGCCDGPDREVQPAAWREACVGETGRVVAVVSCAAAETEPNAAVDAVITVRELRKMWERACVSSFTALAAWKQLPEEPFDKI